jgi:hypothetical protein
MHYHGLDAHVTARALDAQGDLSAIGNQNFLEHDLMGGFSRPLIWEQQARPGVFPFLYPLR